MKRIFTLTLIIFSFSFGFSQTNSLDFDGTNDYVSSTVIGPVGNEARTIEAWIKTTGASSSQQVITEYGDMNPSMRFTFKTQLNKLRIETGGTGNFLETTANIPYNSWVHVAVTYDPLATNQYALYINGVFQVSGNFVDPTATGTTNNLQIGARASNISATKFNGLIDELRIWNYARTEAEILANKDFELCTIPNGLVSYFKFNEGVAGGNNSSITTIADEVNPSATNTLNNFSLTSSTFSNFLTGIVQTNSDLVIIPASACADYFWAENGQTYNTTGQYDIVLTNVEGCDSIRRLDLTIHTIDNTVTDNANGTITANMSGVSYQWLDCDNNGDPISGLTSQTIVVPTVGNYAVEINNNGCLDTSDCLNIASIPSYLNPAMNFDGTNDYIQTSTTGVIGNGARTVEAWVNIPNSNSTAQHTIVDWGSTTAGSRFTTNILNQKLRLEVNGAGITATTLLNDDLWHHIAVTYDPLDGDTVRLYVDGLEEAKAKITTINTQNAQMRIGTRFDNANYFFGNLDEVRVWDVAKTQTEIATNMNAPICISNANLISYFSFNEGVPFGNNTTTTVLKDYAALTETSMPKNMALDGMTSNFAIGPNIDNGLDLDISNETACGSYLWSANNTTYTSNGQYFHTIPNTNGCDSILVLNLMINNYSDAATDNMDGSFSADLSGANYQWLDCDNNYTPVVGGTFQDFTPINSGNYSVEINNFGCKDTSTCFNAVIVATGNSAMNFDGVDDYIETSFSGASGNNARTVEAWIKTTTNSDPTTGTGQKVIVDWGTMISGERFTFNMLWNSTLRLEVGGGGLNGTTSINDGNWHHVAVVYDPLATNTVSLYVDGNLDAEGSVTINTVSNNILIGKRNDNTGYFNGDIDEVRIWNVAKSSTEIAAEMNNEICTQNSNLVAYYNLNEGAPGLNNTSVSTIYDLSGNNVNGTPNNIALDGVYSNYVHGPSLTKGMELVLESVTSCGDFFWDVDNATYTTDGDYMGITTNMNGCDSIVKMNLTIYSTTGSVESVTNCGPYTWPLTGNTHSISGIYNTTLQNVNGCDSVVTLNLTVNAAINGATNNSGVLTATTSGASYKWLNCGTNTLVSGETGQSFTPTSGGSYAVIVDNGVCVDTSVCMSVSIAGIDENTLSSTQFYPNPVVDEMNIVFSGLETGVVTIVDIQGKVVKEVYFTSKDTLKINMNEQETGVYIVNIETENNSTKRRIMIK